MWRFFHSSSTLFKTSSPPFQSESSLTDRVGDIPPVEAEQRYRDAVSTEQMAA